MHKKKILWQIQPERARGFNNNKQNYVVLFNVISDHPKISIIYIENIKTNVDIFHQFCLLMPP